MCVRGVFALSNQRIDLGIPRVFLAVAAVAAIACSADSPAGDDARTALPPVGAVASPAAQPPSVLDGLTVPFEENRGQWDPRVAFKASTASGTVWVTTDGAVVHTLLGPSSDADADASAHARAPSWTLVERFVGSAPASPRIVDLGPTNVSYIVGTDRTRWAPHVRTATRVSLGELWPRVEVELQARGRVVEKFFHVAPGADPALIVVDVEGALGTRMVATGQVHASTGLGDVELSAPVAFQIIDGLRRPVGASYVLTPTGYRFALDAYDRTQELVIDPVVQSTYLGGSGSESTGAIERAADGALLVLGGTTSTDFPSTTGFQPANGGSSDLFIARLDGDLRVLQQVTYLGGSGSENAADLAVDAGGNVLVAGWFFGNDFPGTTGGAQPVAGGGNDMIVARLEPGLTSLMQATFLGGAGSDTSVSITTNAVGEVLIGGTSNGVFPGTAGGAVPTSRGGRDIVVARLNGTLTSLLQSTYFGGSAFDDLEDMVITATGDVVLVGSTNSADVIGTTGGVQSTNAGSNDVVIARLNGALTSLGQATYFGGSGYDANAKVVVEPAGTVVVGASVSSLDIAGTAGGAQPAHGGGGGGDFVLVRLSANLTARGQATYLGGDGDDNFAALARTLDGDLIVAGTRSSTGFPGTTGGLRATYGGLVDMTIARVSADLTTLVQGTYLGCTGNDYVEGVLVDPSGDVLILGYTTSSAFPGVAGGAQSVPRGQDVVVSRVTPTLLAAPTPAEPVITTPADGALLNDTTPDVSGSCVPGFTVRVRDGATVRCTTTCQLDGTFVCTLSSLGNGVRTLTAIQSDAPSCSLALSAPSTAVVVTIDGVAPSQPTITAPTAGSVVTQNPPDIIGTCETGATVRVFEGVTICTQPCVASAFSCRTSLLTNGTHTISAVQVDPAGNSSTVVSRTFTMSAPAPPAITTPLAGMVTADSTPAIGGTCTGATVEVSEGGTPRCAASCVSNAFSCTSVGLADGLHSVRALQLDGSGSSSVLSVTRTFTIDTIPPAAPTIMAPGEGSLIHDVQVTTQGTCEVGARVTVQEGGLEYCNVTCAAAGTFMCTSSLQLDGAHAITATQVDVAGNASPASAVRTFSIDATPPPAPTITTPVAGSVTSDATPDVSGDCETGALVTVDDGAIVCTAVCVASAYTCTSRVLNSGVHTLTASQLDAADNLGPPSPSRTFTVDAMAPAAPNIVAPASGALIADATPALNGSCETGATVTVSEGSIPLCTTICSASLFVCSSAPLGDGLHTIAATQIDRAGNTSPPSASRTFTIDTAPPAGVTITVPTEGSLLDDRTPVVSGTCEEPSTVTIREGAQVSCTAACVAGAFSCTSNSLSEGAHRIVAVPSDPAGNLGSPSVERNFGVDTIAPGPPAITSPVDGTSATERRPSIAGTCESDAAVGVQLADGTVVCADVACTAGAFTCSVAAPLSLGTITLTATQIDRAGHPSPPSSPVQYTVIEDQGEVPPPADSGGCCAIGGADPIANWPGVIVVLGVFARRRRRQAAS